MARTVCKYGDLDLNDGTGYHLLTGFDPGAEDLSYDEVAGADGTVVQVNVSEAHLIDMHVPLLIRGTSLADLDAKVAALNAKIAAGEQTLEYGEPGATTSYSCVRSRRVSYSNEHLRAFAAFIDFQPKRLPLP